MNTPTFEDLENRVIELEKKAKENAFSELLTRTLFHISDAVNTFTNLNKLYPFIHQALDQIMGLPNFYIAVIEKHSSFVQIPFYINQYDRVNIPESSLFDNGELVREVLTKMRPLVLDKTQLEKRVQKKYILLVNGIIKEDKGIIEGLMARSPKDKRKQKIYLQNEPSGNKNLRESKTEYKVLQRFKDLPSTTFSKRNGAGFTLVEASPKTGRKHQLRVHFVHLGHPIAGDKLYSFKNQTIIPELKRQFLHASQLKINLVNGKTKEFNSELPKDIKEILKKLKLL